MKTQTTPFISTPTKSLETHAISQRMIPSIDECTRESTAMRPPSIAMSKIYPNDMINRSETRRGPLDSENSSNGCCR